jgi:hypothetical protein
VLVLKKLPLDSPESVSGLFYFISTFRSYSKLTLEKVTTYCADPAFNLLQARNSSQLVSMGKHPLVTCSSPRCRKGGFPMVFRGVMNF